MTASVPTPDPRLLRRLEPLAEALMRYFDAEVEGVERVPPSPVLLVGNHNGGVMTPDSYLLGLAWYRHTGWREPLFAMGHDLLFRLPGVSRLVRMLGGVPASQSNAEAQLRAGRSVLVYPGGDWETHRPSWARDRIDFGRRMGFVEMARRTGVPIVPVVSAGAHDGWYVLTRGEEIARGLGLDRRLRLKVFPIALGLPFGLMVGPVNPHLPLPHKIRIEFLDPIPVPPEADAEAIYRQVTGRMQRSLDRLTAGLRGPGPGPGRDPDPHRPG